MTKLICSTALKPVETKTVDLNDAFTESTFGTGNVTITTTLGFTADSDEDEAYMKPLVPATEETNSNDSTEERPIKRAKQSATATLKQEKSTSAKAKKTKKTKIKRRSQSGTSSKKAHTTASGRGQKGAGSKSGGKGQGKNRSKR
jgi:hypothetical protein